MVSAPNHPTTEMPKSYFRDPILRYLGGAAFAVLAICARLAFAPISAKTHFTFYYFAVAASVWLLDVGPGIVTLIVCYLAAALDLKPLHSLLVEDKGEQIAFFLSIAVNLGIVFIVSRLKAGQRDLRRAVDQMEALRKDAELARKNAERAREVAENADREKTEYLAVISHELRNPLNSIMLSGAALRRGSHPERAPKWLDRIDRAALTLSKMVERLLDSTRIDPGRLEINRALFDLVPLVQSTIELLRPRAEAKRISLIANLAPAAAVIEGDSERIQDGVSNLLGNAIKFTNEGGRIKLTLERQNGSFELRIEDTGIGIAPEFLPRVFERLAQDEQAARNYRGLGLGLFIVKHVVELHGGSIEASSGGKGQGACFMMTLPQAPGEADLDE